MTGFDDIRFPLGISMGSTAGPEFSTEVTEFASGFEARNRNWAGARLRFNVAPGVRNVADYETLLAFFCAPAGRARGFRFRDWSDWKSGALKAPVQPTDQTIGIGDGAEQFFQLVKTYASGGVDHVRRITRPVAGTVRIALGGKRDHLAQNIGVRGLLHKRPQVHHGIGHRWFLSVQVAINNPTLPEKRR